MKKCLVFGEVLYDIYPTHKKIGGAPLNFGAHFARLGGVSYLCSAVGSTLFVYAVDHSSKLMQVS